MNPVPNVDPVVEVAAEKIRLRTQLDAAIRLLALADRAFDDLSKAERKGYLDEAPGAVSDFVAHRRREEASYDLPFSSANREDRLAIFQRATCGFARRYAKESRGGVTKDRLESALSECLGMFADADAPGPGEFYVSYKGAGLKIWSGFDIRDKPRGTGASTLAMALIAYSVRDPWSDSARSCV
jgi:hypothetical protein